MVSHGNDDSNSCVDANNSNSNSKGGNIIVPANYKNAKDLCKLFVGLARMKVSVSSKHNK